MVEQQLQVQLQVQLLVPRADTLAVEQTALEPTVEEGILTAGLQLEVAAMETVVQAQAPAPVQEAMVMLQRTPEAEGTVTAVLGQRQLAMQVVMATRVAAHAISRRRRKIVRLRRVTIRTRLEERLLGDLEATEIESRKDIMLEHEGCREKAG
jgi:hypothetical protein